MTAAFIDRYRDAAQRQAQQLLPRELRLLTAPSLSQLHEALGGDGSGSVEVVAGMLERSLTPLLWQPLGDCVPACDEKTADSELSLKAMLFWRASVALWLTPAKQMEALAKRRSALADALPSSPRPVLEIEGPAADEAAAVDRDRKPPAPPCDPRRRLAVLRAFLPLFSMTARTEAEVREAAERKRKAEADRLRAEAERRQAAKEDAEWATLTKPLQPTSVFDLPKGDRSKTAAKHTYDVGYKKWEDFDPDADECAPPGTASTSFTDAQREGGRVPVGDAAAAPPPDDSIQRLHQRCEELGREIGADTAESMPAMPAGSPRHT
eukprot:TRINITY_DN4131_c0_g2_i1.p2 TRINITY_DN4131_c0_g2~~TRINITY_DN4131_c0_g2_i1.p2  ORF type:complete len:362 (+),score=128.58 TRINITY_DN4131_c0_g2_i1:120-1088(+)